MAASDRIVRWRYRYVPDHLLGEILTKRWVDNAIPLLILLAVAAVFGCRSSRISSAPPASPT